MDECEAKCFDVVEAAQELKATIVGPNSIHQEQVWAHCLEMLLPKLDGPPIEWIPPLEHLQLTRRDAGHRPSSRPVAVEAEQHLQVLQRRGDDGELPQVAHAGQLHVPEGIRADGQVLHPRDVHDREPLQARAPSGGDGVAERAGAAAGELGVDQAELGQPGEGAGAWHGEAEVTQVEGDTGGPVEAGKLERASSLLGVVVVSGHASPAGTLVVDASSPLAVVVVGVSSVPGHILVGEDEAAGEPARGDAEPRRHSLPGGVLRRHVEIPEVRFVGRQRRRDEAGLGGARDEAELREQRPEVAPAAGEHACPTGGGGVPEAREDVEQDAVGERAQAVHAGVVVGGLAGDVVAAAHRAWLRRLHRTKAGKTNARRECATTILMRLTRPTGSIDGHRAVPARRGVVPQRATMPAVLCSCLASGPRHGPWAVGQCREHGIPPYRARARGRWR